MSAHKCGRQLLGSTLHLESGKKGRFNSAASFRWKFAIWICNAVIVVAILGAGNTSTWNQHVCWGTTIHIANQLRIFTDFNLNPNLYLPTLKFSDSRLLLCTRVLREHNTRLASARGVKSLRGRDETGTSNQADSLSVYDLSEMSIISNFITTQNGRMNARGSESLLPVLAFTGATPSLIRTRLKLSLEKGKVTGSSSRLGMLLSKLLRCFYIHFCLFPEAKLSTNNLSSGKESRYSTRSMVLIKSATVTDRISTCTISNSNPNADVLDRSDTGTPN
ncbi:hypothetical protein J6590_051722 [Homalodisca vitripennis]|nr:hypothetical protein J6590_051722 [Homalodisca vitripennis]